MALSIFADALPFTEMQANYKEWLPGMQLSEMIPNIAYSSSLHWQLYCNKYPDERGVLVDWRPYKEENKNVRVLSTILQPLDRFEYISLVLKKMLDRFAFRRNMFANIPFKFRKEFSERGRYLLWDKSVYGKESIFDGYEVVSQDEGHLSFDATIEKFYSALHTTNNPNIFFSTGFADALGHKVRRGDMYSNRMQPYMSRLREAIVAYLDKYPDEEVLIVSDHGMSTVNKHVDFPLESMFGKPSKKTYIAYTDSCVMCVWTEDRELESKIAEFLSTREEGHLLTEEEREYYGATDRIFGNIIYILREGNVFANSWFGRSLKKPSPDGSGMHGFWPEWSARDQMASVVLINSSKTLDEHYDYRTAHELIKSVMHKEQ